MEVDLSNAGNSPGGRGSHHFFKVNVQQLEPENLEIYDLYICIFISLWFYISMFMYMWWFPGVFRYVKNRSVDPYES